MFWALLAAVVVAILVLGAIVLYERGHDAGEAAARVAYLEEKSDRQPDPQLTAKEYTVNVEPQTEWLQECAQWNNALLNVPFVKLIPFKVPEVKQ